jgi:hypothetical protein
MLVIGVMYDVAKSRIITLRETLHPRSRKFRKSNQQDRRDSELRQMTMRSSKRIMSKYRLLIEYTDDNLGIIRLKVFGKTSTILLKYRYFK